MAFERIKSLKATFVRIGLNQNDLATLAQKIDEVGADRQGKLNIKIKSADEEDTYQTDDPGFFCSRKMPARIGSIKISYRHYKESIECSLSFGDSWRKDIELSVEGTDSQVTELFHDLKKEIENKRIWGKFLFLAAEKLQYLLIGAVLVAAGTYSIFDIVLDSWAALHPDFRGSTAHLVIGSICWAIVLVGTMTSPIWIEQAVKKSLPPIEFSGNLSGNLPKGRKLFVALAMFVFIPILVNVFSEWILDLFKFWASINT
ncbi:MAG: hypothetical protein OXJ63_09620 [Gammaproteobacteria bacterium]|nr:hypothetical protein [Gammaproteobacteria bacterium]